jgi:hypothetical protein
MNSTDGRTLEPRDGPTLGSTVRTLPRSHRRHVIDCDALNIAAKLNGTKGGPCPELAAAAAPRHSAG